jgi:hypothetical protein
MADFNVNASKQIPVNAAQPNTGDSGGVDVSWTPVTPILQGVGVVNVIANQIFGGDQSVATAPATQTTTSQPSALPVDTGINEEAFNEFSLAFEVPDFFSSFSFGDSTPEQRGQFAAQNISANITGEFPSVPYPEYVPSFDINRPETIAIIYTNFAKE